MPWEANESSKMGVDLGAPGGSAVGDWILLGSKELCLYTVVRDDGGSDRWLIDVIRSSNASRDSVANPRYMIESGNTVFTFPVEGTYSFRVRIRNGESSPTDTITTDHYWRKDRVDL